MPTINALFESRVPARFMTFVNFATHEINCKVVYFGPGLGRARPRNVQAHFDLTEEAPRGR